MARNPKRPAEEHLVPEHVAVRFRPTAELKNQVKSRPAPRRRQA
jgi:nucleoid DNA-binding protein